MCVLKEENYLPKYRVLYKRYLSFLAQGKTCEESLSLAIVSPAPQFYVSPFTARNMIYKLRKQKKI